MPRNSAGIKFWISGDPAAVIVKVNEPKAIVAGQEATRKSGLAEQREPERKHGEHDDEQAHPAVGEQRTDATIAKSACFAPKRPDHQ